MSIFITTSMALLFHRRGAGTLLAFGDHSAALAPMAMSPAAIVRSWVLGISSNLQPQPLPWLAYFGLDGAHDLV
jgi:hypothetical protein